MALLAIIGFGNAGQGIGGLDAVGKAASQRRDRREIRLDAGWRCQESGKSIINVKQGSGNPARDQAVAPLPIGRQVQ